MAEKYIDLHETILEEKEYSWEQQSAIADALRWLDSRPRDVPGLTITESQSKGLFDAARRGINFWPPALEFTGIAVGPDPKPTNAEKLADALKRTNFAHGSDLHDIKGLSEALDRLGVKAPGDDDA